jgi:peptide/nickel transport system substrate-binding protein
VGIQRRPGQPDPRRRRLAAWPRRHQDQGRQEAPDGLSDLDQRPRQKTQAIVKQACARAGIDLELKSVVASVFFGSDPANPDNYPHFYSDLQMYNIGVGAPDPAWFMRSFLASEAASKTNKWQGRNVTRWRSEEYDRTFEAAEAEIDPVKRAALFIKMNDLVIQNVVVIPVLWRNGVSASSVRLQGMDLSGWDTTFWRLPYWYKTA